MSIFKVVKGQGEDVVIFHGWGCNHNHMQPIVDQLSNRYRVTNIDLPGRGQSDWQPKIQTIHDIADELLPHLPQQATYIGWSFGGLVAISIAARYPERIKRFVGIATTPKFVMDNHWSGIPQPGFKASLITGIQQHGFKTVIQGFYNNEFADFDPKPAAYNVLLNLFDIDSSQIDFNILLKGLDICDSTDLRKEFKSLHCPIDLILSERDDAVPTDAFEKIKELNLNITIYTIPDAHHMAFWTHPDKFNKILNKLL